MRYASRVCVCVFLCMCVTDRAIQTMPSAFLCAGVFVRVSVRVCICVCVCTVTYRVSTTTCGWQRMVSRCRGITAASCGTRHSLCRCVCVCVCVCVCRVCVCACVLADTLCVYMCVCVCVHDSLG